MPVRNPYENFSVRDMGLSNGATNALLLGDINTFAELLDVISKGNLMKYRNIGATKYTEIVTRVYEIQQSGLSKNLGEADALRARSKEIAKQIADYEHAITLLKTQKKICDNKLNQLNAEIKR